MIGDASGKEGQFSDSDKKTAENFGIDYVDVDDFVNVVSHIFPKFEKDEYKRFNLKQYGSKSK